MKSFCRSELTLNCRFRQSRIKLTHTTWVVWEAMPKSWLKGCNAQLCMYVCNNFYNFLKKVFYIEKELKNTLILKIFYMQKTVLICNVFIAHGAEAEKWMNLYPRYGVKLIKINVLNFYKKLCHNIMTKIYMWQNHHFCSGFQLKRK